MEARSFASMEVDEHYYELTVSVPPFRQLRPLEFDHTLFGIENIYNYLFFILFILLFIYITYFIVYLYYLFIYIHILFILLFI